MVLILVILSLSILILGHELGHFIAAKWAKVKIDEFGFGFPPRIFKKKKGETTYSINAIPFGGFVRMRGEHGEFIEKGEKYEDADVGRNFSDKSVTKRSVITLSGVAMNFILGWLALSIVFMMGVPRHLFVPDVAPDSPAESAGLKAGDIIIRAEYAGKILQDPIKSDDLIGLVKSAGSDEILLSIEREKERKNFLVRGRENPPEGQGSLGVALSEVGFESKPIFASFIAGVGETWNFTRLIISGFFTLVTKVFTSPEVLKSIAGPVGIVSVAKQAGDLGFVYLLQLIGLISINLAVLNLLPFPALDGGRFIFLIFEKIKGSPISARFQTAVNVGGLLALLVLMVLVTIQDVSRLFN